jgi:DNA-binding response OmpR family regulator
MSARKTKILIIDDDSDLREALAEQIDAVDDYKAEQAGDAADGIAKAHDVKPALILLDVHLPDADGRDVCARLRAANVRAPIIMLTGAATTDPDQVQGFESGANDYLAKPFKFSVLLARMRAHLRTAESSEDAAFGIGPYEFRPGGKLLVDQKGKRIPLTDKETSILKYLYRAGAKAVAREELLREVWGYNAAVTTHTLETHIYRLRQKIETDAQSPKLLITETGGYRLQP